MDSKKSVLGSRIRMQRDTKGLSSNQLALKIGIRRQSMSDIELGKIWPSVPTLITLAEVLDCSLDWLCGLTERPEGCSGPSDATV